MMAKNYQQIIANGLRKMPLMDINIPQSVRQSIDTVIEYLERKPARAPKPSLRLVHNDDKQQVR